MAWLVAKTSSTGRWAVMSATLVAPGEVSDSEAGAESSGEVLHRGFSFVHGHRCCALRRFGRFRKRAKITEAEDAKI